MSRKRVPPEAQIIALFTGLSDEGKRMVMFGLNAIMSTESPKSPAPSAERRSSRKGAGQGSIPSIAVATENASTVSKEKKELCGVCGNEADYQDHFEPSPNYHKFDSGKKKASAA